MELENALALTCGDRNTDHGHESAEFKRPEGPGQQGASTMGPLGSAEPLNNGKERCPTS